jgi:uncharacterized protein YhbP (UPF0306 family)
MDIEQKIREYLPEVLHMSLATSIDNKPWVCEVHYVYDDELNIYFRSKVNRRHSREIAQNPNVAANIVTQHNIEQKPRGVYLEGRAEALEGVDEDHIAYKLFSEMMGLGPEILEDAMNTEGHRFYKITVTDYYLFDARESSPSQKYHLKWGN